MRLPHTFPAVPPGELNGKSANLNNCLAQLYPTSKPIPASEILVVFDADMVPNPNFFTKILEAMQVGRAGTKAANRAQGWGYM